MKKERIFVWTCKAITLLAISFLFFIFLFIAKESFIFFQKTSLLHFLTGSRWNPIADPPAFGLQPMICATVYVSLLAALIALPIGVGMAIFLSVLAPQKIQRILLPLIDLMAGIPSVVYGFVGLMIIVKFFETHFSWSSGESVLTGSILLAIMILPYIVSTCCESMTKVLHHYQQTSRALSVSKWHMIRYLVIPSAKKAILAALILSLSRAMGETMAVMMVIGNSPIFPHLFRKAETIPALIALEMGGAAVGSLHYQALFAAGFILMFVLFAFNSFFFFIRKRIEEGIK
ncbi:MAG: phosphate ABC transporter permease subunit PstC [Aminobacterium sp.]|uniref:phosphate ABC transporter permease subunit PstC n=1 Tax=Aminobacterium sp. MB27-C1 TaxID=3070661 RepID=UPI001BCCB88B|nr:phosphate ABC transporter permease subunit PstC [Aminobacterium sp. MB27-C1]MDD2206323.1 phosphate ABC transporter permease subunit PstC [Aminobacterium sp.]MDD3707328.1 phosphate ABC transporter permease subunit PstC [Aminobacterium sp.]MDD4551811.1 phosphate ABC transporter permease subunit PstC [Aminobacterium sp.]WMI71315.1 phosphate ABC transporter permease subunit PstC [Aminobacterium sp. MB27-C1]